MHQLYVQIKTKHLQNIEADKPKNPHQHNRSQSQRPREETKTTIAVAARTLTQQQGRHHIGTNNNSRRSADNDIAMQQHNFENNMYINGTILPIA